MVCLGQDEEEASSEAESETADGNWLRPKLRAQQSK